MNLFKLAARSATLILTLTLLVPYDANADVVVEWNFEDSTTPDIGTGSVSLMSGVTASFDDGPFGNGNRAWFTTNYADQFSDSGQRGVQFLVDTTGYEELTVDMIARWSGDTSRYMRVDYTINGGEDWRLLQADYQPFTYDTFTFPGFDLSQIGGASNNPNFGIRFLSVFSPEDFEYNGQLFAANTAYQAANDADAYSPSGHFAIDYFSVSGAAVPEPSHVCLFLGAAVVIAIRNRKIAFKSKGQEE